MIKKLLVLLLIVSVFDFGISFANSIKSNSNSSTYELSEVVVSSKKPVTESAGTVYRISEQDIKNMGATNLKEALRHVPGLAIRTGNSGTPRVDIRGFRTRHVQLLLNGVPMNDTYDGQFDPTTIPIEYIAEIKVISGAASVLYGNGGNGGVINILTKKAVNGVHGGIGGEMAEYQAYLGKAFVSAANEKFHSFISCGMYDREAYPMSDNFDETKDEDGEYRENSDRRRKNIFANLGYIPSDQTSLGMTFHHVHGENGVPPITNYDKKDPFTKSTKYERIDRLEGSMGQLSFKHQTNDGLYVRGTAFINFLDSLNNKYDDNTYSSQDIKKSRQNNTETTISGAHFYFGKNLKQNGNLDMAFFSHDERWDAYGFEIDKKGNLDRFREDEDIQNFGIALSYNKDLNDKVRFVLEYGHHFIKKESDENDFSYLLGVDANIFSGTKIKAFHAKKVRFPSLKQLYDIEYGNSDLVSEQTYHYELGLTQKINESTQFNITGFYINALDFIEKDLNDFYENNEEYQFQGVEISVSSQMIKSLQLSLSYSFLDSQDKREGSEKDELQHRPNNKVSFIADYTFSFGLKYHFDLLHLGRQFYYDSDGKDPLEKKRLNDYTVVNMKFSQKLPKKNAYVYIGADNIFDEDYEQSYGLPRPGRKIFAGFELQF